MISTTVHLKINYVYTYIVIALNIVQCHHCQAGCAFDAKDTSTEKLLPVILRNDTKLELVVPEKGKINLNSGEKLTFACPEKRNTIKITNSNFTEAMCLGDTTLKIGNTQVKFQEIECKKPVRGEVKRTNKKCAKDQGHILQIGYQITRKNWITLIEVCYDEVRGNALYTDHTIHGAAIKYASKSSYRPGFSTAGLPNSIPASVAFKQAYQKSTFNKLLGSAKLAERYINDKSYLSRGHLSPDADFLFASSQFTTYYLVNVAPQWQTINGGIWKSLEQLIRKTAAEYSKTFRVITGTYGILSFPDSNNNNVDIFLGPDNKLPVPQYTWKIMYDHDAHKGIVFVVLNNPFVEKLQEEDKFCEDISCSNYGWIFDRKNSAESEYIFCCDVKNFEKFVDLPKMNVKSVLER